MKKYDVVKEQLGQVKGCIDDSHYDGVFQKDLLVLLAIMAEMLIDIAEAQNLPSLSVEIINPNDLHGGRRC